MARSVVQQAQRVLFQALALMAEADVGLPPLGQVEVRFKMSTLEYTIEMRDWYNFTGSTINGTEVGVEFSGFIHDLTRTYEPMSFSRMLISARLRAMDKAKSETSPIIERLTHAENKLS